MSGILPVEGRPLEQTPIEAIGLVTHEDKANDISNQHIGEIVKQLDEAHESPNAATHSREEANDNPYIETIDTKTAEVVTKKTCKCEIGKNCFKCILGKVFSLEPFEKIERFFEPEPVYEATCVSQPAEFVGVAGADFSATCTFKNTGTTSWPVNVQLKLVNGKNVVYNGLGLERYCVQPGAELNVTIELKLPQTPGKYNLSFRLVHGENKTEFGDEVTANLVAKADTEVQVPSTVKPIDYQVLPTLEEPLIETNGDTFYVDQDRDVDGSGESDSDDDKLSANSWEMVRDDDEANAAEPPCASSENGDSSEGTPISSDSAGSSKLEGFD